MTVLGVRLSETVRAALPGVGLVPRPPSRLQPRALLLIDVVAVLAATFTVSIAYGDLRRSPGSLLLWLAVFNVLIIGILIVRRAYRFRLSGTVVDELGSVVIASSTSVVLVVALRAFVSAEPDAGLDTLWWGAFAAVNLAVVHVASYRLRRRRFRAGGGHETLIVGAGTVGRQVARRFLERPEIGLRPVGFLDKAPRLDVQCDLDPPILGASWDLERQAIAHNVDQVVIAFSTAPHQVLVDIVRRSHALGLHVLMVPRLFEEVPLGKHTEFAGGIPLLRIEPPSSAWQVTLKYMIDRVVAAVALVLLAPIFLMAAVAVRRSSKGPIFFRQRRVGLDGREFDMLKFRTMAGSADVQGEGDAAWVISIIADGEPDEGPAQSVDRRTTAGRVLRKLSVDELPQLINVLRGEMSLVGPRPERAGLVPMFNQNVYRYADRHRMKGGITGWAQVHDLRGETSLVDRVEWDNRYIQHWSLCLDLKILLLTIPAMIRGG